MHACVRTCVPVCAVCVCVVRVCVVPVCVVRGCVVRVCLVRVCVVRVCVVRVCVVRVCVVCDVMCAAPLCRSLQKEPKERGDLPLLLVSSGLSWLGWVWNGFSTYDL